jgi:hypothetical protein
VQLVQHDQGAPAGPARRADLAAVVAVIPTEVQAAIVVGQDPLGEGGLADLARAGEPDHLPGQILANRRGEGALGSH